VAVLREYRDSQKELGVTTGNDDFEFCHYNGSPYLPDSITHTFLKLARKCGLAGIRLHDVRHTHASLMLKQGIHPKIGQERLGHSRIQVTLDTYSHVAPGLQQAAAARFDDIITVEEKEVKVS